MPRPILPVAIVPGQHSFKHVKYKGRDYVVLRNKMGDPRVLMGAIMVLLTPLVFPYGLDIEVFLILLSFAIAFLLLALRISLRKLFVSIEGGRFEIRYRLLATPRTTPLLRVPARVFVGPVRYGGGKVLTFDIEGTPVGTGCLLHTRGSDFTVLALQESRGDVLRLIQSSPVLRQVEVVEVQKDIVLFPMDPRQL